MRAVRGLQAHRPQVALELAAAHPPMKKPQKMLPRPPLLEDHHPRHRHRRGMQLQISPQRRHPPLPKRQRAPHQNANEI